MRIYNIDCFVKLQVTKVLKMLAKKSNVSNPYVFVHLKVNPNTNKNYAFVFNHYFRLRLFSEKQLVIFIVFMLDSQKLKTWINESNVKVLDLGNCFFKVSISYVILFFLRKIW